MPRLLGQATVLIADWLTPDGWEESGRPSLHLWPAGWQWDAVRTPDWLGRPVLERLLAAPRDAAMVGPVLRDRRATCLYWLVLPGATGPYPDGAQLLTKNSWLAVPAPNARPGAVTWLHLPDQPTLTGPAWLAAALWTQTRLNDVQPGAAMPDQPADLDDLLNSLKWEDGVCSLCPTSHDPAQQPVARLDDAEPACRADLRRRIHLGRLAQANIAANRADAVASAAPSRGRAAG